jgi:hypothetical protein
VDEENKGQDKERSEPDKDRKKAMELKEMLEKMFGKDMGNKANAEINKVLFL